MLASPRGGLFPGLCSWCSLILADDRRHRVVAGLGLGGDEGILVRARTSAIPSSDNPGLPSDSRVPPLFFLLLSTAESNWSLTADTADCFLSVSLALLVLSALWARAFSWHGQNEVVRDLLALDDEVGDADLVV